MKNNYATCLSMMINDELKKKLYAACEAPATPVEHEDASKKAEVRKATTVEALAEEMLANNAAALRKFRDLQTQKAYLLERVMGMQNVNEVQKKRFLYGKWRNGVMYARDFNDLLHILTQKAMDRFGHSRY